MVDVLLSQTIREYESDTFSASGSKITEWEADEVSRALVQWFIDNRLDGVLIDSALADVRESEKKYCTSCGYVEAQSGENCKSCGKPMTSKI